MMPEPLSTNEMMLRYVLFAVVATLANLLAQESVIRAAPAALAPSIAAGTIAGFTVKYVLDKVYVFSDAYQNGADEARKVALYGVFSVATTLVFWSFELAAWTIWGTTAAKYAGAALGLSIGYAAKFALDRRFVFRGAAA